MPNRRFAFALAALLCHVAIVAAETPAPPQLSGSLTTEQGVRVLRLWGTADERGYAHGRLLGERIVGFVEDVLLDPRVMPVPAAYETMVRAQILPRMQFSPTDREELAGMMRGITDQVGEASIMLERLGRPMDIHDLAALNTLADWNPSACSTFAAWGPATVDGGTIVARNLDYFNLPGIAAEQIIVAYVDSGDSKRPFVSVTWPGLIGVYTGMNADGLFVATHDAPGGKAFEASEWVPRSLMLRRVLEQVPVNGAASAARELLAASPTLRGNNFLLAWPYTEGAVPAVVFEYDGREDIEGGVTVRDADSLKNGTPKYTIACTNHYRVRGEPAPCDRYQSMIDKLDRRLGHAAKKNATSAGKIGADDAFEIIKATAVRGTIHTVIALPNAKTMEIHFATDEKNAAETPGLRFELSALLRK
jgi:hypothetical protein